MKRGIAEVKGEFGAMDMANCLMLLSKVWRNQFRKPCLYVQNMQQGVLIVQALGGRRASHKKPKLMGGELFDNTQMPPSPKKPKTHECSICGVEFPIGQALGGHMRRHRAAMTSDALVTRPLLPVPVLKKSNSSKRVVCLDLNLTPFENDLKLWVV